MVGRGGGGVSQGSESLASLRPRLRSARFGGRRAECAVTLAECAVTKTRIQERLYAHSGQTLMRIQCNFTRIQGTIKAHSAGLHSGKGASPSERF